MKLAQFAVKRPVTILMFTLATLLFGLVALGRLPVTLLPDLSYPNITVRTSYLGAAPGEVEQLINRPIEESLGTVRGVRNITSYARANQSDIVLEFAWGTDMNMAAVEVREKLDMVPIPLDIEKPMLLRFNPNMEPMMRLAMSGDSNLQSLRRYADEELKRRFESLEGVAAVRTGGGLEDEIQILIQEKETAQLDISPDLIVRRLKEENLNQSGGRVQSGRMEFLVRTMNQFQSLEQMQDIYITTRNQKPIRLKDIAEVKLGAKDRTSISRINGQEAIEINLYREGDANTVQVADTVLKHLKTIQEALPAGYEIELLSDQSDFIRQAIASVQGNAVSGGLLAMLIILLFLRQIKPTLIISISIPISVIATFFLMYSAGLSLNIMSLGGVALAIGLLVDNAIVVLENISRRQDLGQDTQQAAIEGTQEVSSAVTASTLTTLAVFVPLIFVSGIAGQLFIDQALTVVFALIASLIVALTLIPMLASKSTQVAKTPRLTLQRPTTKKGWRKFLTPLSYLKYGLFTGLPKLSLRIFFVSVRFMTTLAKYISRPIFYVFQKAIVTAERSHARTLMYIMQKPKVFLLVFIGITGSAFLTTPYLKTQLLPTMEQKEFYVDIEMPRGTKIERTDEILKTLADFLQDDPRIERSYSVAGIGSLMQISASQGGDYWGRLNIVTYETLSSAERQSVINKVRQKVAQIPDLSGRIDYPSIMSIDLPFYIEIQGHDLDRVKQTALALLNILDNEPNFIDIQAGIAQGQPELSIYFNHDRLVHAGLNASEAAQTIATKIGGQIASKYNLEDRQIDMRVRLPDSYRYDLESVGDLIINPGAKHELPLAAVADIKMQTGPGEITRINQQRVAIISMGLADGNLQEATAYLEKAFDELAIPPGVKIRLGGQSEQLDASYQSLMFALILAVFLVYLVMASQFESFGHPLLIMFSVPLAAAGSILGLVLTNTPLSVVVFIGLIMLSGIVVNNAIVLIDRINQLREIGTEKTTAILEASSQRLRPILMTTLTTVLGLLPLSLGIGEGAELTSPMAITVMSGLSFATLLTLFFIPLVYQLFDRKKFEHGTP